MGKDVLEGISSFGKGFAPGINEFTRRQQEIKEEERRFQRDQDAKISFQDLQNVFQAGQQKERLASSERISAMTQKEITRRIGLQAAMDKDKIRLQSELDANVKMILQQGAMDHDFAIGEMKQFFNLEQIEKNHLNNKEFATFSTGLKEGADKRASFRAFFFNSMMESAKMRFTDAQNRQAFKERMQEIGKSKGLDKKAQHESLVLQHMISQAPTLAYMMVAAKANNIEVTLDAEGKPHIDWADAVSKEGGEKNVMAYGNDFEALVRSGIADALNMETKGLNVTDPEDLQKMMKMQEGLSGILKLDPAQTKRLLQERILSKAGEAAANRDGEARGNAVRTASGMVARNNKDTQLLRKDITKSFANTEFVRDSTRADFDAFSGLKVQDMVETQGEDAQGRPKAPKRVRGLMVLSEAGEEAFEIASEGSPGVVAFDPVEGEVIQMYTSSEHLPERWKNHEGLRKKVSKLLDEVGGENVEDMTRLFEGKPTRGVTNLLRTKGQDTLSHPQRWNRYRSNLKKLGVSRLTPRTPSSVRRAILAAADASVWGRGVLADFLGDVDKARETVPPQDTEESLRSTALRGFGDQNVGGL